MTAVLALLLLACNRTDVDRAHWQQMSRDNQALYVRTLIGYEKAKQAKGGNDLVFTGTPEQYVQCIDAAYGRGDQRDVPRVFESCGVKRK